MRLRGSMAVLGALTALAAGATTAQAVTPIPLGPGGEPRAAERAGVAHFAWVHGLPGGFNELRYCHMAVGAHSCSSPHSMVSSDSSGWDPPFVFAAAPNRVVMVASDNNQAFAIVSEDGGATWGPRQHVGDRGLGGNHSSAAALGPGPNDVSMVTGGVTGARPTYEKGTIGAPPGPDRELSGDIKYQYAKSVAMAGGHPVASYSSTANTRFSSSPDDGTTFSGPFGTPAPGGSDGILRGGPGGVFLMRDTLGHTHDGHLDVSKLGSSSFGSPHKVEGSEKSNHDEDFSQDGGGRLHAVFSVLHPGSRPVSLRYTSSGDGGRHWSTPLDAVRGAHIAGLDTFSIAAASFARGFIAYGTSVNPDGTVYAVPLPKAVCKVPKLKGKSLAQAKKALLAAHCRLGKVTKPKHPKTGLVVSAQNPKAGKVVADKSKVKVKLAAKH